MCAAGSHTFAVRQSSVSAPRTLAKFTQPALYVDVLSGTVHGAGARGGPQRSDCAKGTPRKAVPP